MCCKLIKSLAICFALTAMFGFEPSSSLDICAPFNKTLEQLCGYGTTVKFQHQSQFDKAVKTVKHLIKNFDSCSAYANLMICSTYIPRCVSNIEGPYLPCRRVCDEFEGKCGKKIAAYGLEFLIGLCKLLPKKDDPYSGYLGRCFKPPGFHTTLPDDGAAHPLKCYPLVVPKCQNIGYNYTIVSTSKQQTHIRLIDMELNKETNDSSDCILPRRKFLCTEFFAPCMNQTLASYCRKNCNQFFDRKCTPPFHYQRAICMEYPTGASAEGICQKTQWPRLENWHVARQVRTTNKPIGPLSKLITYQRSTPGPTPSTSDFGKDGKAVSSASLVRPRWAFALGVGTVVFLTFRSMRKSKAAFRPGFSSLQVSVLTGLGTLKWQSSTENCTTGNKMLHKNNYNENCRHQTYTTLPGNNCLASRDMGQKMQGSAMKIEGLSTSVRTKSSALFHTI